MREGLLRRRVDRARQARLVQHIAEDTPGVRVKSSGLRTPTGIGLANSVVAVLPTIIAPACLNRATQFESRAGR